MELFEALGIKKELIQAVTDLGFSQPTPIQEKAIPILLEKTTDFVGLAQTGTGKTAAFGLPLLHHVDITNRNVQALILAPTRELCVQIASDLEHFAKYLPQHKIAAVYGGANIVSQIRQLKSGVHIVAATPGRLMDLIERKAIDLSTVQFVVLDEADEMLNMGFRDDIDFILGKTTQKQSTWLFSATMPKEVRSIANRFMNDPQEISLASKNTPALHISHEYYITHSHHRYEALKRIIDFNPGMYGIIFTRTKLDAQEIAEKLVKEGYDIDALHGDLTQQQRDKVMNRFREKSLQLLIATDVAARGIDVDGITHVINYALPDESEVYTHRSGRTGRAGRSGICMSLLHARELGKLKDIERMVKLRFEKKDIPGGKDVCEKQFFHFFDKLHNTTVSEGSYESYLPKIKELFEDQTKEEILTKMAVLELNHFLEYYQNAADLNVRQFERRERPGESSLGGSSSEKRSFSRGGEDGNMTTLFISLGSKDGFYKASFLQFILDMSDLKKEVLGMVSIRETFSHVEVEKNSAQQMISALDGKKLKGRSIRVNHANQGGPSSRSRENKGQEEGFSRSGGDRESRFRSRR
ncbi:MAG: DEAD/DEAH box helicase [Chitinophagaceae bacterium]